MKVEKFFENNSSIIDKEIKVERVNNLVDNLDNQKRIIKNKEAKNTIRKSSGSFIHNTNTNKLLDVDVDKKLKNKEKNNGSKVAYYIATICHKNGLMSKMKIVSSNY